MLNSQYSCPRLLCFSFLRLKFTSLRSYPKGCWILRTGFLLESLRERAIAAGFEFLSTLIEDRLRHTGPAWLRSSAILQRNDNYLRSGTCFAYLQAALQPAADSRFAPKASMRPR